MLEIVKRLRYSPSMQVPKRKSEERRQPDSRSQSRYLTAAAIERLKRDLEDLERNQRPKTVEDLTRAREMGDLSENAAYTEAKARLGRIDGRIFSLKDRLKNALVIEPGAGPEGKARIGATVVVRVNGAERSYQIVGSQETNPARGLISHLSPLGAALLNRAAGDVVIVKANGKEISYTVVAVR